MSHSGVTEREGIEYPLAGILELWEGRAYCYALPVDISNVNHRREEILVRTDEYIEGRYNVKTLCPQELDQIAFNRGVPRELICQ